MVTKYFHKIKDLGIGKILLILFAGILFLLSYDTPKSDNERIEEKNVANTVETLDCQLEEILMSVEGVSQVKVLISYEDGGERILKECENTEYRENKEQDSQGGSRVEISQNSTKEYLYSGETPYVVIEKKPTICGVLIVYRGEAAASVNLLEAAKVITGVNYNRIKVLLMN